MPGSYAHITLVNEASERRRLKLIDEFPSEAIRAANSQVEFLELGSISPDYPYLRLASRGSKKWADVMHHTHTCQTIYVEAELVRELPKGRSKDKCLAWLMGYTAHVVADMCIHPVVELKVGSYKGHERPHRQCEMHQDVYISRRMGVGDIPRTGDYLKRNILKWGVPDDPEHLDEDIKRLWEEALKTVHSKGFTDDPPDVDKWHRSCYDILQKFLPTTSRFVGFARHVCDGLAISYPTPDEIDKNKYVENLMVPGPKGIDRRQQYDEIFDFAKHCVQQVWLDITRHALDYGDFIAFRDKEWDLDSGKNNLAEDAGHIFWKEA